MGQASKDFEISTDDDVSDRRSNYEKSAGYRRSALDSAKAAVGHAADVLLGRKRPSRDESTLRDRTGAQDAEDEADEQYKAGVKRRREEGSASVVRG